MLLRPAGPSDIEALTAALQEAANWDGQARVSREQLVTDPHHAHYLSGWPRPGDFGTIAVDNEAAIGAAWCRLFEASDPGYGYVADDVPELSLGVHPNYRGRGVGTALLTAVIAQAAARGHRAISLSVEDANRAKALYRRAGFMPVRRDGGSETMLLRL